MNQPMQDFGYQSNYISDLIKTKSIRRLIFGIVLVVAGFGVLGSQYIFISNMISGPREIETKAFEAELLSGKLKNIYVTLNINPNNIYSTGYTHYTETVNKYTNEVKNRNTDKEFFLTGVNEHLLGVEVDLGVVPSGKFTGYIIPMDNELETMLRQDFKSDPELNYLDPMLLPYTISDRGFGNMPGFWISLLGLALLITGLIIAIKRKLDIADKKHYIYQIFGNLGYMDMNHLSNEFLTANQTIFVKSRGFALNNKFLYSDTFFFFKIYPLSQLEQAYKFIQQQRINFIPAGKTYFLKAKFKPNKTVSVMAKEKKIDEYLDNIEKLCPNAKIGF